MFRLLHFLDYFYNEKLLPDDAEARKIVYHSEKFVFQNKFEWHFDLPRLQKKLAGIMCHANFWLQKA